MRDRTLTMPLGPKKRQILNAKDELIAKMREQKGWGDEQISKTMDMTRQGVWKARKRYYERTGDQEPKIDYPYKNRMMTTKN